MIFAALHLFQLYLKKWQLKIRITNCISKNVIYIGNSLIFLRKDKGQTVAYKNKL